jgi:hypothetical protein
MKQSRKDFIIEAHDNACNDWRNRIEKEFPKLFKKDSLEVGKWYRNSSGSIFNYNGVKDCNNKPCGYGIGLLGSWYESNQNGWGGSYTLATDKEVEQSLIKEAEKRGFKKGVIVRWEGFNDSDFDGIFRFQLVGKNILDGNGVGYIFNNGKWATIVETITKEQAEKELGKTILN